MSLSILLGHYAVEIPHDATTIRLGSAQLSNDLAYYVIQLMTKIHADIGGDSPYDCSKYQTMYTGSVEDTALCGGLLEMTEREPPILNINTNLNVINRIKQQELSVANNCSTIVTEIYNPDKTLKNIINIGNLSVLVDAGSSFKGANDFVIGLKNVAFKTSDGHFFHIFNTLECIENEEIARKDYYLITCSAIHYNGIGEEAIEGDGPQNKFIVHSYTRLKIFNSDTGFEGYETISVNKVKPIWQEVVAQMSVHCPKTRSNEPCSNTCNLSLKESLYYLGCASSLKFHGDMGIAMETILGILVYGFELINEGGGGGGETINQYNIRPAYVAVLKKKNTESETEEASTIIKKDKDNDESFVETVTHVYNNHCTASKDRNAFLLPFYFFRGRFTPGSFPYSSDPDKYSLIFRDVYTALNSSGQLESKFEYSAYAGGASTLSEIFPIFVNALPAGCGNVGKKTKTCGGGSRSSKRQKILETVEEGEEEEEEEEMSSKGGASKKNIEYYQLTTDIFVETYILDRQYEIAPNIYNKIKTIIEYKELVYGCLFLYMLNTDHSIKPILFSSGIDITDALFQDFQMDTVRKIYNIFILSNWTKNRELINKPLQELISKKNSESNIEYFTVDELMDSGTLLEKYDNPESIISDTLQLFMQMNPNFIRPDITCGELFQIALQGLTHSMTEDKWNQLERMSFTSVEESQKKTPPSSPLRSSATSVESSPKITPPESLESSPKTTPSSSPPRSPPRIFNPEKASELDKRSKRTKRKITRRKNGKRARKQTRKHRKPRKRRANTRRK